MTIKDILQKVARTAQLDPFEMDEFVRWGARSEVVNSQVAGAITPNGELDVDQSETGARVYLSSNKVLTTGGADNFIAWDVEDYDDKQFVDLVANPTRLTLAQSGRYDVGYNLSAYSYSPPALSSGNVIINGSTVTLGDLDSPYLNSSGNMQLNAGDYLELRVRTTNAMTLYGDSAHSFFWVTKIRGRQ